MPESFVLGSAPPSTTDVPAWGLDATTAGEGLWKWNPTTGIWERRNEYGEVQESVDPFGPAEVIVAAPVLAYTVSEYNPVDDQELAMAVGDEIVVLQEDESGWWHGRNNRTLLEGWLPSSYVVKA